MAENGEDGKISAAQILNPSILKDYMTTAG
jgi:hypothetical protein